MSARRPYILKVASVACDVFIVFPPIRASLATEEEKSLHQSCVLSLQASLVIVHTAGTHWRAIAAVFCFINSEMTLL